MRKIQYLCKKEAETSLDLGDFVVFKIRTLFSEQAYEQFIPLVIWVELCQKPIYLLVDVH